MGERVPVQCGCGYRMQAEAADLGQDGVCPRCGRSFLLWPADDADGGAAWYVRVGARELGPFDETGLRRLVAEGRIQPRTPLRRGREGAWVAAQQVRGLLAPPRPPPPPPPVAAPPPPPAAPPPTARPSPTARIPPPGPRRARGPRAPRGDVAAQLARQPGIVLAMAIGLVAIVALGAALALRGGDDPEPAAQDVAERAAPPPKAATDGRPSSPAPTRAPPPSPTPPKELTTRELVAKSAPSVAVVLGRNGSGTGFLVDTNLVATNRHVIGDELLKDVRVKFPDAEKHLRGNYGCRLLYEDPRLDLAFLVVEIELPALPLAERHEFTRGEEVTVIGSPGVGDGQILQNAISRGLVSSQLQIEGVTYHQLDVAINPGNSGGPVFDARGQVIGVVTLKAMDKDGLGFCLPLDSVRASLARARRMDREGSAQMAARHRLRVTSLAVLRSARFYALAGEIYVASMQAALAGGGDLNEGLQRARGRVHAILDRIDGNLLLLVREGAPEILTDANLADATRERFNTLWNTYQQLKEHVERPTGTFDSFKAKVEQLSVARDRLAREFKAEEGVDDLED